MNPHAYAVILAGGKGERFWPLSTSKRPKQLLDLVGDKALIAQAVERVGELIPPDHVFVVTNADIVEATRACLPQLPKENIVGEPMGRDTAAAVALACVLVEKKDPKGVFCILTADHVMKNLDVFNRTLSESMELASQQDVLITMGIRPLHPDTGFGYINVNEALAWDGETEFHSVKNFEEKPDLVKAKNFVESGTYYWNSGMFIWSAHSLRLALTRYCPALVRMMDRVKNSIGTEQFIDVLRREYEQLSKISIDYALMEKASNIVMAVGTFDWDDVGSWPALEHHFPADEDGNTRIGQTEVLDCSGNIILSRDHLTACIGVKDLVVVQADGVTLVCPKERAQDIKKLVKALHERGDCEALL